MEPRIEQKLELSKSEYLNILFWLKFKSAKILYPKRIICSRYFDNYNLSMYHDTVEGITPRKKLRIRTYNTHNFEDSKSGFNLEFKMTSERNRFKKIEQNIQYQKYEINGIYDDLYGLCYPKLDISYEREYYVLSGTRITIDKNINYKLLNIEKKLFPKNNIDELYVLEIKADISSNIDDLSNKFDFPRTRFSKYERAVESLKVL